MNPLCTVQDLSALIQVTVAVDDAPALAAIAAASAAIRGYCHQALSLVTGDHVVLSPACGRVLLPELPVVAVSAVSLAGTVLDPAAYGFEAATGELLRFDPLATPPPWPIWWDSGFRNVAVTYTHGYATLPDDLVNVCARVAARQYLGGLRSALVGPHASESDYAAVYQGEPIGETAGAYGPTSAVILTGDEKRSLDQYRPLPLGLAAGSYSAGGPDGGAGSGSGRSSWARRRCWRRSAS
jgi:hypothetical protein